MCFLRKWLTVVVWLFILTLSLMACGPLSQQTSVQDPSDQSYEDVPLDIDEVLNDLAYKLNHLLSDQAREIDTVLRHQKALEGPLTDEATQTILLALKDQLGDEGLTYVTKDKPGEIEVTLLERHMKDGQAKWLVAQPLHGEPGLFYVVCNHDQSAYFVYKLPPDHYDQSVLGGVQGYDTYAIVLVTQEGFVLGTYKLEEDLNSADQGIETKGQMALYQKMLKNLPLRDLEGIAFYAHQQMTQAEVSFIIYQVIP